MGYILRVDHAQTPISSIWAVRICRVPNSIARAAATRVNLQQDIDSSRKGAVQQPYGGHLFCEKSFCFATQGGLSRTKCPGIRSQIAYLQWLSGFFTMIFGYLDPLGKALVGDRHHRAHSESTSCNVMLAALRSAPPESRTPPEQRY